MKYSVFYAHALEAAKQKNLSIDEILGKVKQMGYSGFEVEYNDKAVDAVETIRKNDLEIAAFYYFLNSVDESYREAAEKFFSFAKDSGAKYALIIPGFIQDDEDHDKAISRILEAEKFCVETGKKYGIQVTMEDFDDRHAPFSTLAGIKYFLDNIPDLRHAFDSGNYYYSGEDCLRAFELFPEKIAYAHFKDRALTGADNELDKLTADGKKMYACPVGEGVIDIRACAENLRKLSYNGWIAIEHFGSANMLDCMQRSIKNVKPLFENV